MYANEQSHTQNSQLVEKEGAVHRIPTTEFCGCNIPNSPIIKPYQTHDIYAVDAPRPLGRDHPWLCGFDHLLMVISSAKAATLVEYDKVLLGSLSSFRFWFYHGHRCRRRHSPRYHHQQQHHRPPPSHHHHHHHNLI